MQYWFLAMSSEGCVEMDSSDGEEFLPVIGAVVPSDDNIEKERGIEWRVVNIFQGETADQLNVLATFEETFGSIDTGVINLISGVVVEAFEAGMTHQK